MYGVLFYEVSLTLFVLMLVVHVPCAGVVVGWVRPNSGLIRQGMWLHEHSPGPRASRWQGRCGAIGVMDGLENRRGFGQFERERGALQKRAFWRGSKTAFFGFQSKLISRRAVGVGRRGGFRRVGGEPFEDGLEDGDGDGDDGEQVAAHGLRPRMQGWVGRATVALAPHTYDRQTYDASQAQVYQEGALCAHLDLSIDAVTEYLLSRADNRKMDKGA